MRFRRGLAALLALIVAVGLLAGCAATQPTTSEVTVKIGVIGARSGPAAELGTYLDGAVAAFRKLNDDGGIRSKDGRVTYKFEVLLRDDEANPAKGKELTEELILKEKVVAIVGPTNTANALQMIPVVFENKVPLISGVATGTIAMQSAMKLASDTKSPNWFFRTTTPDAAQAEKMAMYIKAKGFKKVAILHDDTAYGKGGLVELQGAFKSQGIESTIATVQQFAFASTDLTPQVQKAKEAGADIIVGWALGHHHAMIAVGKAKLGVNVPQLGSTAIGQVNFRALAKEASEGAMGVWPRDHAIAPEGGKVPDKIQRAYDVYKKYFPNGHPLEQFGSAVFTYDAAMMIADGIAEVGPDRVKLRDYLESGKHVNGASKPVISYSANQHEIWTGADFAITVIKKGQIFQTND